MNWTADISKNMNGHSVADRNSKMKIEQLKKELLEAQQEIAILKEKERVMRNRLVEQAQKMVERGTVFENLSLGENRPSALIRRYGNLYSQTRIDTLDVLDCFAEFQGADELKSKLMFTVIVLAFHSAQNQLDEIFFKLREIFHVKDASSRSIQELEKSVNSYLRNSIDSFDMSNCVTQVCNQIWSTLYDFPRLKDCDGFLKYIKECVHLAWGLINQNPPYSIDFDTSDYCKDSHIRFHTSDQESVQVKYYMWPALMEGNSGLCVYKAIVVT